MRHAGRLRPIVLTLCLTLCACASPPAEAPETVTPEPVRSAETEFVPYETPPIALSAFHPDKAEGRDGVLIDLSAVGDGYVAVSAVSEHRLKFQALKDELTYTYNIASDGTPSIFPLQCGDGLYTFRVMENVAESRYAQLYATECIVVLTDEFQPFLRPSDYADYGVDSVCVKTASRLAANCGSPLEIVRAVYDFVCATVTYDSEKASTVQAGYMPVPDDTLLSGKGICFDYASLTAAMLRSQSIPTKLIFGYVAPNDLYHAWNMFYTEESGWVTVSFETVSDTWVRIDLTFSAGGAPDEFVGDGSHYSDVYFY